VSRAEVAITGVGAVGAFGVGLEALAACLGGGHPLQTQRYEVRGGALTVGQVSFKLRDHWPGVSRKLGRMDRGSRMFLLAGREALQGAGLAGADLSGTGVALGSRFGCLLVNEAYHRGLLTKGVRLASPLLFGYTVPSAPAGELSIAFGLTGPNLTVVSGDASGGGALARAAAWIRAGRARRVVAGGCDPQGPWLAQELWDRGIRDGRGPLPAEGAAALVLEPADEVRRRGVRPLATLGPITEGFGPAGDVADPLADRIGRTYAASAPLALAARLAGGTGAEGATSERIEVRDGQGYRVAIEWTPGPPTRSGSDDGRATA